MKSVLTGDSVEEWSLMSDQWFKGMREAAGGREASGWRARLSETVCKWSTLPVNCWHTTPLVWYSSKWSEESEQLWKAFGGRSWEKKPQRQDYEACLPPWCGLTLIRGRKISDWDLTTWSEAAVSLLLLPASGSNQLIPSTIAIGVHWRRVWGTWDHLWVKFFRGPSPGPPQGGIIYREAFSHLTFL